MDISSRTRERFCKDCKIPIGIFEEPYFSDRLKLYDILYGTVEKWNRFTEDLKKYHCEQDYFENYNSVKEAVMAAIKNSEAFKSFNEDDMSKYTIKHTGLPSGEIYHPGNNGKLFISVDMRHANFSALSHYAGYVNKNIFNGAPTWEDFISLFTNSGHIIHSKYIRQVIMGNCNPRRQGTYEKYLMDQVIDLLSNSISSNRIVFFSNDEIVFDVSDEPHIPTLYQRSQYISQLLSLAVDFPLRVEPFKLVKISGTDGYAKKIIQNGRGEYKIELKHLDNYVLPFVLRKLQNEEVTENDKMFYHRGLLAKFVDIPEIWID